MREPARTPHAARQRYTRILQQSLSCITPAHWYVGPSPSNNENLALAVNPRSLTLHREGGASDLRLTPSQLFTIVDDVRYAGEYKASTLAYIYSVELASRKDDSGDTEVIAWHWHPLTTPDRVAPHVHVGVDHPHLEASLSKLHIPTGRVAFEEVIRFLIEDLHVKSARVDWQDIVGESEARFKAFRTWS